jgi:hypothetical protein
MRHITQWYCKSCKLVLARDKFPKHIDANTRCTACQQGRDTSPGASGEAAPQPAVVRVHHPFPRRHGRDRNEQS